MLAFPNAKINIGLNITGKRPDGYHNIETVFYPVKISDALEVTDDITTSCTVSGIAIPGKMTENICLKAYELLASDFDLPPQKITLYKGIPIGAGLGGGSSDAAWTLRLLNERFKLGLSDEVMRVYAGKLGADCAFFVGNTPAYARGKGDELWPVELCLDDFNIILVQPSIHVSTQDAYAEVKPSKPRDKLHELITLPVKDWKGRIINDFELSVFTKYPEIALLKESLYEQGALFAQMSGSGSSVFGIFEKDCQFVPGEQHQHIFQNI